MSDRGLRAAGTSIVTASVCAFAMIATQVAGKATRDALFLSHFDISALPVVLIASAVLSIGAVLATARAMVSRGPLRVIPPLFLASAVLLVAEFLVAPRNPRLVATVVYLHVSGLGSILISGFWSIINEHFDPRSARRSIGRIVGAATMGGLFGGLLAERIGAQASLLWVLPVIAALHVMCAILLLRLSPAGGSSPSKTERVGVATPTMESGVRVLARVGYLRNLALIVLLGNTAATLIDYLFKASAAGNFVTGAELVRFFAVFYTIVSVGTLAVQAGMTSRLLEGIGIVNTLAIRPAFLTVGGLATLPVMGIAGLGILRAVEAVLQSSFFRSGYELLFTPVVPADKRSTKTLVDVGADRMGDVVGGMLIRTVILLPAAVAGHILLSLAVAISVLGYFIARALRRGYIAALEASLANRAGVLDITPDGPGLRTAMMETFAGIDLSMTIDDAALSELRAATVGSNSVEGATELESPSAPAPVDPEIASLVALRSGEPARVHTELRRQRTLSPALASQAISLLAWDEVTGWASHALAKAAPSITGQLVDRMLDPTEDFAIRRRIPRVLSTCATQRAHDGLMAALADARFEVRFQSALALARIHEQQPALRVDPASVYAAVMKETGVDKALWHDQGLIDPPAPADAPGVVAGAPKGRSSRRMEYVFTLLSLVLPGSPLKLAYKGLLTDDALLRGTGLEYVESVLPREVWKVLQPFLDDRRVPARERPREEVLDDLMRSSASIELNLKELRRQAGEAQ